jgi:uncharacterized protein involved in outer membrane biogenesis
VLAAAAIVVAVPFVVPVARFIPELARFASQKLGQPVRIEGLTLHLVPTPRIVGHRITVGRRAQVRIGELEIEPDFVSLVRGPRTIRRIRAHRVSLDEAALDIARGMPKGRPGEPVLVRRLTLTAVKLNHSKIELPVFDADARLGEGFRVREALLVARDGSFQLRAKAGAANATALTLQAKRWTLPGGAPLYFEVLAARGTLRGQSLELERIEGELYGGKVAGEAQAGWDKQWQLAGRAQLFGVDLVPLQKALGKPAKLSGRLNADATFSSRARTPAELAGTLALDGPFEVLGGVYQGVDLARAGEVGRESTAGDATTFEELRGRIELRGERVSLQPLCMRSPTTVAGGNVEIAPDKSVSGRLDISVAQTGGFLGVPVTLGGTTEEVSLRPTKGYLIGAAIGTALLPGIGTSIGSALGGKIEGGSACR